MNSFPELMSRLAKAAASAPTNEESNALSILHRILHGYEKNPDALKTLLGKIQSNMMTDAEVAQLQNTAYPSLDDVKSALPPYLKITQAA